MPQRCVFETNYEEIEMTEGVPTRFLIIIRVGEIARVGSVARSVNDACQGFATGGFRVAFTSATGETFGMYAKTPLSSRQVHALVRGRLLNGDDCLVIELGEDWMASGNSRGWEWLQHH